MQKFAPWRRPTLQAPPSVFTGSDPPRRVLRMRWCVRSFDYNVGVPEIYIPDFSDIPLLANIRSEAGVFVGEQVEIRPATDQRQD